MSEYYEGPFGAITPFTRARAQDVSANLQAIADSFKLLPPSAELGFKKGDPGGNAMAIGLFTQAFALNIPIGTDLVQTSGYNLIGRGAALYAYSPAVDAAYVTANPRTSFMSANGRGFRLATADISATTAGATGSGLVSDLIPLKAAIKAIRGTLTDGSRIFAGIVKLPPGRYLLDGPLNLAELGPVAGLVIAGSGAGCTEIVYTTSTATILAPGSRELEFHDITFRALDYSVDVDIWQPGTPYGVALMQSAFTIHHSFGAPDSTAALRSWKWERCIFAGFYKCFDVTGASMCSEFFFDKCGFAQCFIGMDNSNDQAVNWNFVNCNWENEGLDLTGTALLLKNAALFKLQKGTSVKWTGGSIIYFGSLVYYNLTTAFAFGGTTHKMTFDGIRVEICDNAGTIQPMFDRPENGTYVGPGNAPASAFINSVLIVRGSVVPGSQVLFKVWDNSKTLIDNCEIETQKVRGVYSALSAANTGVFKLTNTNKLPYEEDTTNRTFDHIRHSIVMEPESRGGEVAIPFELHMSLMEAPFPLAPKAVCVRGQTGSLPNGGDTVLLVDQTGKSIFEPGTVICRIVVRRFHPTGNALTVQLKKFDDTTLYGEAVLAAGADRVGYGEVNAEIGFQIPAGEKLMLKAIGPAEVAKGIILIECL